MAAEPAGGMRSVLTALRILEEVAARQPVGVSDLSRALGMPKSSVQRGVQTLHEAAWLKPTDTAPTRWLLSLKALTVGLAATAASGLQEIALEQMRPLRDALGETVHLGVPEGPELVIIGRLDGTQPLRAFLQLGTRAPLHASAGGRAILAAMPDAEVERVLDSGIRRYTPRTITDRDRIRREVEQSRERGYAVNEGEWRADIAAVGAAVLGRDRRPVAAVSVSLPRNRYAEMEAASIGELVMPVAARISQLAQSEG